MADSTSIFIRHIDVVFFFYGLAFFSMGLAVWIESRRSSEFRLASAMVFLAGFGLIHGLHEWMDMFARLGKFDSLSPDQAFIFNGLRIGDLVFSFVLLVVFGIRLIYSNQTTNGRERSFSWIVAALLVVFWLASTLLTRWIYAPTAEEFIISTDVLARYIIGIPGALLAAWAIFLEQRAFKARGMPDFGKLLLGAAIALVLYGLIGQLFVTPSFLFPANIINSVLFFDLFGFPVQLLRAIMAAFVAIFVIRALRAFEIETQQNLAQANEARLAAQREALEVQETARIETEQLNKELQTAVQELSILYELSRNLAATIDRDTILQKTISQIFATLPRIGGGLILLREKAGRPLELVALSGYEGNGAQLQSIFECPYNQAILLGEYVAESGHLAWCDGENIIDLGDAREIMAYQENDPLSIDAGGHTIGVPLLAQNQIAGSMVLSVNPDTDPFTQRDLSMIIAVAGQLSIAIENASLYKAVQERDSLRGKLLHQVVAAQEQERQRIARELHDSTGQTLTALGLGLAAANENITINSQLASRQLSELRALNAVALEEIHHLIADLRPSLLDNLGLVAAMRSQVQAFSKRSDVSAAFTFSGESRRVDPDIEMIIFRIAQEALTNVAKHAQATEVKVRLIYRADRLCLRIRDNGCGFDPDFVLDAGRKSREAWGLLGMQERVALVGGRLFIKSNSKIGTIIQVCIPTPVEKEMVYVKDTALVGG